MPGGERRTGALSGAAFAGMFVFGIVMALVGAVLPSLEKVAYGTADIGRLFLAMNAAMLATSLVVGLAMDRFGMKPPLALGPLLVAGAVVMVRQAAAFHDLLPAMVLLGIGGGALNGATNTLVADLHDDAERKNAALNRLGVFFGFGALFLPFALGRMAAGPALAATALLSAGAGGFAAVLHFPAPKQRNALPMAEIPGFLRSPLVLALAALLFCESGAEFTLGGYISTYLTRGLGVRSVGAASWILAGFWTGIMVARVVAGRIGTGRDLFRTLTLCGTGACCGSLLTAAAPGPAAAAVGVAICGASLAGVYPATLAIAGARFQSHSGTVFGILFAVALAGGMLVPWVAGQVGGAAGLRWVFGIVAAAFASIAALSRLAARVDRARGAAAA